MYICDQTCGDDRSQKCALGAYRLVFLGTYRSTTAGISQYTGGKIANIKALPAWIFPSTSFKELFFAVKRRPEQSIKKANPRFCRSGNLPNWSKYPWTMAGHGFEGIVQTLWFKWYRRVMPIDPNRSESIPIEFTQIYCFHFPLHNLGVYVYDIYIYIHICEAPQSQMAAIKTAMVQHAARITWTYGNDCMDWPCNCSCRALGSMAPCFTCHSSIASDSGTLEHISWIHNMELAAHSSLTKIQIIKARHGQQLIEEAVAVIRTCTIRRKTNMQAYVEIWMQSNRYTA